VLQCLDSHHSSIDHILHVQDRDLPACKQQYLDLTLLVLSFSLSSITSSIILRILPPLTVPVPSLHKSLSVNRTPQDRCCVLAAITQSHDHAPISCRQSYQNLLRSHARCQQQREIFFPLAAPPPPSSSCRQRRDILHLEPSTTTFRSARCPALRDSP
jgi:hypothetical protein